MRRWFHNVFYYAYFLKIFFFFFTSININISIDTIDWKVHFSQLFRSGGQKVQNLALILAPVVSEVLI